MLGGSEGLGNNGKENERCSIMKGFGSRVRGT